MEVKDLYDIEGKEKQIRAVFAQHDANVAQYKFNSEDNAGLIYLMLLKIKTILEDLPSGRQNGV